jgi:hypothetical protein
MIMKNYFMKSSMMLMAVSAALASCTQEDVLQNTPAQPSDNELKLSVSTQDFVSDAQGRAITNNNDKRTSEFENGDQMGLYIFSEDEEVLCDNLLYTYTDGKWTTDKTIYQYKNAQYVAYFPYCKDLSGVTGAESITEYFKANILPTVSQTNAEAYEQADLMIATTSQVDGSNVNLTLAHQFSMIELNIPCRKYITSATDGFQYAAPVKMKVEINEKTELYRAADGVYRMIVNPGTAPLIEGSVEYDENMPIYFSSSSVTMNPLKAGTFTQFNVTYTDPAVEGLTVDEATGRYIRPLQPGDYYYSDGTIYPYTEGTVDQPITEGCIGVIFEVGTGAPDTDWTHGSVLALTNAWPDWSEWGGASEPIEGNNTSGFIDDTEKRNFLMSKMDGYKMSAYFTKGAMSRVKVYGTEDSYPDYKAPQTSSGWYLPSTGQLVSLMKGLGKYEFTVDNLESVDAQYREGKLKALSNIENAIVKVKGVFWDNDGDSETFQRWWTTTEHDNLNVWAIEWKRDGQIKLLTRNKTQGWNQVKSYARPVLSF